MGKGRPKKLSETLNDRPQIHLNIEPELTDKQIREQQLINKIRSRASIYSQEELNLANEIYIRVGQEGSMCMTCPSSIARAFEIILHHNK